MTRHRWHHHYHPYYGTGQACGRCGMVRFRRRKDRETGRMVDFYCSAEGWYAYLERRERVPACREYLTATG